MHRLDELLIEIRMFGPEFQISLRQWREFVAGLDADEEQYLMTASKVDALDWVAVAVREGRVPSGD